MTLLLFILVHLLRVDIFGGGFPFNRPLLKGKNPATQTEVREKACVYFILT